MLCCDIFLSIFLSHICCVVSLCVFVRECMRVTAMLLYVICSFVWCKEISLPASVDQSFFDTAAAAAAAATGVAVSTSVSEVTKMNIPKELWRLVDALWQGGGMTEADLFATSCPPAEIAAVRESLDCGTPFPPGCSAHAIAETIVCFLAALPTPLLPVELYPTAADVEPGVVRAWCRRFLEQLQPLSYNLFVYMLSFQRELLLSKEENKLTHAKLAAINVTCMTVSAQSDGGGGDGEQDESITVKLMASQEALHAMMLHFLSSTVI